MRKTELEQYRAIFLTKETHTLLRKEKKRLIKKGNGKSMAMILNNLIIKKLKK